MSNEISRRVLLDVLDRCEEKVLFRETVEDIISEQPSSRPTAKWSEMEVHEQSEVDITEWQSARCTRCNKYHTTPYSYYFQNYNYCPHCGARMVP